MKTIFVGKLPGTITKEELQLLFSQYGNVKKITLTCARARPSQRIAFIDMDETDADCAIEQLNDFGFDHLLVVASEKRTRSRREKSTREEKNLGLKP